MRRFRIHLWDERNGKTRVLIWPARDVAAVQAGVENWLIGHHWYHLTAIEEREMSEAIKGTAYTPTLTPGLQASVDRDLLPAWRKAKDEAYLAGMAWGSSRVMDAIVEMPIAVNDPYLQYLYLLGVGQAIANRGRDIVGAENLAAKAQDTPGKNR